MAEKKEKPKVKEKVVEKKPARKKFIQLKPRVTEKAIMMLESQNTLGFEIPKIVSKDELKEKVEETFEVKVENVRTHIQKGKKYAYVKLKPENLAIDIATKLGMI